MAEIHNFYAHWKEKQESLRKSLGYPADLWYTMLDNGYEPTNEEEVEKFLEDMMDNE